MITKKASIPQKSANYLLNQDIIWAQFNDINFYVEDIDQENFYYELLKKLFPDIVFDRIFPLGGKDKVILDATNNIGNKKKIYILDLDFDEILEKKVNQSNLFYLTRYSIENFLFDERAICEFIKEQKPKLKDLQISSTFNLAAFLMESKQLFSELTCSFIVIQKNNLGISYIDYDPARFCNLNTIPSAVRAPSIQAHYDAVENALKNIDKRLTLKAQMKKVKHLFITINDVLKNIPGKHLLKFLKHRIEHLFSLSQTALESFTFRLAKLCSVNNLDFLKNNINSYITS